jgi:deazaflavin-dependent oxidoreductase (nitroreductase family)
MTTTDIRPAIAPRPSHAGEVLRWLVRQLGPLFKPLAGRRFVTIWAIISYRGRRSGKEYAAPIAIGTTPDSFVIPLPFAGAQWVLNVLAAGECTIRWNGGEWRATEPQIIDKAEASMAFGPIPRVALRFLPIDRFLRLRRVEA